MSTLSERLNAYTQRVNAALASRLSVEGQTSAATSLDAASVPPDLRLQAAMYYAATIGGKRIRPILTYATGNAFGVALDRLDCPACSVELLHAYSLVHDDLPAMDDDDLRRGNPTCHVKFDEATAILAGDALQALAFTLLAKNDDPAVSADNKLRMIEVLGDASGAEGMAAGQAIDLAAVGQSLTLTALEDMHRLKTGALIRASVVLPTLVAGIEDPTVVKALDAYAAAIGLAFQIVDDILDVVSDTETLGKTQGADIALDKPTYPSLLGLDGARKHAQDLHHEAMASLDLIDTDLTELRLIADYVIERSY